MFKKIFSISDYNSIKKNVSDFFNDTPPVVTAFDSKGHSLNLLFELNDVWLKSDPKLSRYKEYLIDSFSSGLSRSILLNDKHMDELFKKKNSVSIDYIDFEGEYCFKCGKRHNLRILSDGTLLERNVEGSFNNGKIVNTPLKPCLFSEEIVKRQFTFNTDTLIMSDYFRFNDNIFSKWIGKVQGSVDINSAKGLVEETDHYLKKGVFKVQVGNSSPTVIKKGNSFYFGYVKEDSEKLLKNFHIGSICTDLWATCVMEKSVLMDVLLQNGRTKEQALKEIKDTVNIEIKIEPGTYEITCNSLSQHLSDDHDEFSSKNLETLYFTMNKVK